MKDIVERLENVLRDWDPRLTILLEARDEIIRLRDENKALRQLSGAGWDASKRGKK